MSIKSFGSQISVKRYILRRKAVRCSCFYGSGVVYCQTVHDGSCILTSRSLLSQTIHTIVFQWLLIAQKMPEGHGIVRRILQ